MTFRNPAGDFELSKRDIILFFIFRKLRYMLINQTNLKKEQIDLEDIYQSFSQKISNNWFVGLNYDICF